MRQIRSILAALVLLTTAPTFAAEVKPPPAKEDQAQASVPVDPKQVVCKRVAASDQQMLPGAKVCHTRAEWAELEKNGNGE
jgi:hypothetical protein